MLLVYMNTIYVAYISNNHGNYIETFTNIWEVYTLIDYYSEPIK